jgi:hypothetical protein
MYRIACSPVLHLFKRSAKILDDLAIEGIKLAVRGHDRNETGYPIDCRACTSFAFTQRLLRAHDCCHVRTGASIATEFSVDVKHRLAAGPHVHRSAVAAQPTIYEITERFARIESFPDKPPLFRFRLKVESVIPAPSAYSIGRMRTKRILGQEREFVVRTNLPKPIGGSFGVVTEFRFALPQPILGALGSSMS